jgi:minor histocompatibility antigen H13
MSSKDAWMFPLVGSTVLFGLYILFKYFSKEYINLLLTGYFLLFGLGALSTTLAPWLEDLGTVLMGRRKRKPYQINFTLFKEKVSLEFTYIDILAWTLGLALISWYAYEKHWIANNLIGLAFCIQAIAMISLGSYKVGCILLVSSLCHFLPFLPFFLCFRVFLLSLTSTNLLCLVPFYLLSTMLVVWFVLL